MIIKEIGSSVQINSVHRIPAAVGIGTEGVVLLGEGVDGGPGGSVVAAGAEVVQGDAEGDALQGPCPAGGVAVGEGAVVVIACPGGVEDRCLRPVGEI